jgi:hypothetical protein
MTESATHGESLGAAVADEFSVARPHRILPAQLLAARSLALTRSHRDRVHQ